LVGIATALMLGLRHGIDWDHIAAITDIASSQANVRRSLVLSTLYILGHSVVVLGLGLLAILGGDFLPSSVDDVMQRIVGVTLLALGIYVMFSLIRHGREFQMRSRWMILLGFMRRVLQKRSSRRSEEWFEHEHPHPAAGDAHNHHIHRTLFQADGALIGSHRDGPEQQHSHLHRHPHSEADYPFASYGRASSLTVGMLHGIGAETPTQIVLLLTAAQVGGIAAGLAILAAFMVGIIVSNTAVALASSYGYGSLSRVWPIYLGMAAMTSVFSLWLGFQYLFTDA
jgi:high-affinity nickel permease